ncbi:DNA oxidative demethylase ALKBH2 like protein [Argiope bruennichi]|uniref:DNA oxidative demethylase ALKBH2 n=1 Tax=Argiope bruennichi TaxID=94029 RepID=A0A8T0F272_ARGBR|nr:DNA oxidative demethylase ALKBH2 like protein [Argiope bruennichi]
MSSVLKPETSSDFNTHLAKKFKKNYDLSCSETNPIKNEKNCGNSEKLENLNRNSSNYSNALSFDSKNITTKDENSDSCENQRLEIINFNWRIITGENLKLRYAEIFSRSSSKHIMTRLEKEVEYYSGDLLKVRVYGKWHEIPRKQVAFGDDGLSYKFSGNCLPSKPWETCPIIFELKKCVESVVGYSFNFVLVNRYKDGSDHMGEHRDDEKELDPHTPIASLSFGAVREFIFRHMDTRGKNAKSNIQKKKIDLHPGSLLLMEFPTNRFWYHSLPSRKNVFGVRVNLTFRKMIKS